MPCCVPPTQTARYEIQGHDPRWIESNMRCFYTKTKTETFINCYLVLYKSVKISLDPSLGVNRFFTIFSYYCGNILVGRSWDRFPVVSLEIFSVVPPKEPCALSLTQPLKVSTRDFSWSKGGRCVWLTTYHPCSAKTSR